ncbi:MAG: hypothetical protein M0C28_36260 [Candidatus Moduliflexus flocculans]|nr:hypothetical protein [Candidatus Moduliflexus flocculans]
MMQDVRGEATLGEFGVPKTGLAQLAVHLATATYVPPPVDEMNLALGYLERKFIHTSRVFLSWHAAMIHYQFKPIHHFGW